MSNGYLRSRDYVEVELLNGKRLMLEKNMDKVYDLYEKPCLVFKWSSSFPFFHIERRRVVRFRYRKFYDTIDSWLDPRYTVNCTLVQFTALFGVSLKPFELAIVQNDINFEV